MKRKKVIRLIVALLIVGGYTAWRVSVFKAVEHYYYETAEGWEEYQYLTDSLDLQPLDWTAFILPI